MFFGFQRSFIFEPTLRQRSGSAIVVEEKFVKENRCDDAKNKENAAHDGESLLGGVPCATDSLAEL